MTFFDTLLTTDIPIDWTTLLLGWDGLGDRNGLVTTEQLQSYAMDQIGYGPESEFELVSGIAFAEARDFWTIRACLEQLASDTPSAKRRAIRVWRWVMLSVLVQELEEGLVDDVDRSADPYWFETTSINVWSDLRDFWEEFPFPAEDALPVKDWNTLVGEDMEIARQLLSEHRQFLKQEEADLRKEKTTWM